MDPSLDARGSERSLEVALADPAEGSDDVAYYFHDGSLVERRRHGCGEAARTDCDCWLSSALRALHLHAKSGDSYVPRVEQALSASAEIARASPT